MPGLARDAAIDARRRRALGEHAARRLQQLAAALVDVEAGVGGTGHALNLPPGRLLTSGQYAVTVLADRRSTGPRKLMEREVGDGFHGKGPGAGRTAGWRRDPKGRRRAPRSRTSSAGGCSAGRARRRSCSASCCSWPWRSAAAGSTRRLASGSPSRARRRCWRSAPGSTSAAADAGLPADREHRPVRDLPDAHGGRTALPPLLAATGAARGGLVGLVGTVLALRWNSRTVAALSIGGALVSAAGGRGAVRLRDRLRAHHARVRRRRAHDATLDPARDRLLLPRRAPAAGVGGGRGAEAARPDRSAVRVRAGRTPARRLATSCARRPTSCPRRPPAGPRGRPRYGGCRLLRPRTAARRASPSGGSRPSRRRTS